MMNKKMKNGFMGAVFGVSFVLFASSAYFIATEDYDIFFHSKKGAADRNLYIINDNYRTDFYNQQCLECKTFFVEKEKMLDSMRTTHRQKEDALFAKADSAYRLSDWYQKKVCVLNDSIAIADNDTVIDRFKKQQEKYLKKSNVCEKIGRQYYDDGVILFEEHWAIRNSFFNNHQPPAFKKAEDLTKLTEKRRDSLIKDLALRRLRYANR